MPDANDIFAQEGLSNIFNGALIPQLAKDSDKVNHYRVIGCRLENSKPENVQILQGRAPDSNGIYSATIFYDSHRRRSGNRQAFFFPRNWTKEMVINAISEAFRHKYLLNETERHYIGLTSDGLMIAFWLNEENRIIDAMPLREGSLTTKGRGAKRASRFCEVCGEQKQLICPKHKQHFNKRSFETIGRRIKHYFKKAYFEFARQLGFVD